MPCISPATVVSIHRPTAGMLNTLNTPSFTSHVNCTWETVTVSMRDILRRAVTAGNRVEVARAFDSTHDSSDAYTLRRDRVQLRRRACARARGSLRRL